MLSARRTPPRLGGTPGVDVGAGAATLVGVGIAAGPPSCVVVGVATGAAVGVAVDAGFAVAVATGVGVGSSPGPHARAIIIRGSAMARILRMGNLVVRDLWFIALTPYQSATDLTT